MSTEHRKPTPQEDRQIEVRGVEGVKFYVFPSIPYLPNSPKKPTTDRYLPKEDCTKLFGGDVTVTEKVDGTNVGISFQEGQLILQKRSGLITSNDHPQYNLFRSWAYNKYGAFQTLPEDTALFGEWCQVRHQIDYSSLPDYFLLFDVWSNNRFLSPAEVERTAHQLDLQAVPTLFTGRVSLERVPELVGPSMFGQTLAEGVVVSNEHYKAKYVREGYSQGRQDFNRNMLFNSLAMSQ